MESINIIAGICCGIIAASIIYYVVTIINTRNRDNSDKPVDTCSVTDLEPGTMQQMCREESDAHRLRCRRSYKGAIKHGHTVNLHAEKSLSEKTQESTDQETAAESSKDHNGWLSNLREVMQTQNTPEIEPNEDDKYITKTAVNYEERANPYYDPFFDSPAEEFPKISQTIIAPPVKKKVKTPKTIPVGTVYYFPPYKITTKNRKSHKSAVMDYVASCGIDGVRHTDIIKHVVSAQGKTFRRGLLTTMFATNTAWIIDADGQRKPGKPGVLLTPSAGDPRFLLEDPITGKYRCVEHIFNKKSIEE